MSATNTNSKASHLEKGGVDADDLQMRKLPNGWKMEKIGSLGVWTGGGTPSKQKPEYWNNGTIPWVSPKDMKSVSIDDTQDHITKDAIKGSATKLLPVNSLLVVTRSGILQHTLPVATNSCEVTLNQDLKALIPREGLDVKYLYFALRRFNHEILHKCCKAGTTVQSIEFHLFKDFEIPLPPLPEQRRIVARIEELFSHLDAGVAALRHAKAQLQRYRQSVLAAAVTGQLCGCENNKWRVVRLEDLVTIKSGNGFPKRFQGKTSGDYPFYKVGDISANWQEGRTSLISANNYLDEIEVRKIRGTLLPANTTVFAKIGAAVALNRRGLLTTSSLVDNNVMGLIPGNDIVPEYLFWFMCQVDLGAKTRGGAVPSLRKGDLEEIEINLPPLAEQHQIVAEVEARTTAIDHLEAELDHQITRSNRLRQSTLAAAFSGIL